MLDLSVDKLGLKRPFRATLVDEPGRGRGILRCDWAALVHDAREQRALVNDIVNDRKILAARDDNTVTQMCARDDIVLDGPVGDDRLSVVGPDSRSDVDGDLEVRRVSGDVIPVNVDVSVIALPGSVVDKVDA